MVEGFTFEKKEDGGSFGKVLESGGFLTEKKTREGAQGKIAPFLLPLDTEPVSAFSN